MTNEILAYLCIGAGLYVAGFLHGTTNSIKVAKRLIKEHTNEIQKRQDLKLDR